MKNSILLFTVLFAYAGFTFADQKTVQELNCQSVAANTLEHMIQVGNPNAKIIRPGAVVEGDNLSMKLEFSDDKEGITYAVSLYANGLNRCSIGSMSMKREE